MRTYETIYIVHPEIVGDGYTAVIDKFKGILTDQQANVLKIDEWGTRKLAYTVKKQGRGTSVLMAYEAGGYQDTSLPAEGVENAEGSEAAVAAVAAETTATAE